MYWYIISARGIVLNSRYVFVGLLAVILVINTGYKIFEGFSLRLCDFSP